MIRNEDGPTSRRAVFFPSSCAQRPSAEPATAAACAALPSAASPGAMSSSACRLVSTRSTTIATHSTTSTRLTIEITPDTPKR